MNTWTIVGFIISSIGSVISMIGSDKQSKHDISKEVKKQLKKIEKEK